MFKTVFNKIVIAGFFLLSCIYGAHAQQETTMPVHPKEAKEKDSVSMADVAYLRNISTVISNMEDSLGINAGNMASMVKIQAVKFSSIPDTSFTQIIIPYSNVFADVMYAYTRLLSNAVNLPAIRALVKKARAKSITRTVFADGIATIESKAIFNQVLAGLETSMIGQLHLPSRVINAGIDHLHKKINTATALYMMYDYVKKSAVDSSHQLVYKQYLAYYDLLRK